MQGCAAFSRFSSSWRWRIEGPYQVQPRVVVTAANPFPAIPYAHAEAEPRKPKTIFPNPLAPIIQNGSVWAILFLPIRARIACITEAKFGISGTRVHWLVSTV